MNSSLLLLIFKIPEICSEFWQKYFSMLNGLLYCPLSQLQRKHYAIFQALSSHACHFMWEFQNAPVLDNQCPVNLSRVTFHVTHLHMQTNLSISQSSRRSLKCPWTLLSLDLMEDLTWPTLSRSQSGYASWKTLHQCRGHNVMRWDPECREDLAALLLAKRVCIKFFKNSVLMHFSKCFYPKPFRFVNY